MFALPPAGKARDKALVDLPKQACLLLEIVAEAAQERLNIEALDHVLETGKVAKGIDPKVPAMGRFRRFFNWGTFGKLVTKEGGD